LKIGLTNIGSDQWIGGIYYISNLVRALRSLPTHEQPEILLRITSGREENQYQGIADLVHLFRDYSWENSASLCSGLMNPVKANLRRLYARAASDSRIKVYIQTKVDDGLYRKLRARDVSLLFPCPRAMSEEFRLPWLPWVWDLQHKHYPEFFSKKQRRSRDHVFLRVAESAKLIVTSSEDALSDFDHFFPGYHEKFRVLHFRAFPAFEWFESDAAKTRAEYDLPPCYLVLPNQFWVHKNHKVVFEATKILADRSVNVHVVCTGNTVDYREPEHFPRLTTYVKDNDIQSRIHILGLLPRLDQIQIVRGSVAVIQPSLFEGWSTVVEDARALGKHAFLSDIPVHREQNLPGAIYFDPHDPEALADGIAEAWGSLAPGPSAVDERKALARQQELVVEYGRDFMKIADELIRLER
jgi:glycosyltransferase involved in cell wall biosynthesis